MHVTQTEARMEINKLKVILKEAERLYRNGSDPLMTDGEFEQLYARLEALETEYPTLKTRDSPTSPKSSWSRKKGVYDHKEPMLSIRKGYDIEEVKTLALQSGLEEEFTEFLGEEKIDGVGVSFIYKKGKFVRCLTKGDGLRGIDVTVHASNIQGLPIRINSSVSYMEVRGEVYVEKQYFNERYLNKGYSNPRNFISSLLMKKRSQNIPLHYFVFDIGHPKEDVASSQVECKKTLQKFGFRINENSIIFTELKDLKSYFNNLVKCREKIPYEIDGIVIKVNSFKLQKILGTTTKYPRYALALKFPAKLGLTIVKNVDITVGRSGILTPIAEVAPVMVGGVSIGKASLHNFRVIKQLDVRIGDTVELMRAGDVIPKISRVVRARRPIYTQAIVPPSHCPGCNGPLAKQFNTLTRIKCLNSFACKPQILRKMAHFVSKEALNIEGLAINRLQFLLDNKFISNIPDLFKLGTNHEERQRLLSMSGWSKTSVDKMLAELDAKRTVSFATFIYSLGIDEVGPLRSSEIAGLYKDPLEFFETIQNLTKERADALRGLPNVGESCILQLKLFSKSPSNIVLVGELIELLVIGIQQDVGASVGEGNSSDEILNPSSVLTNKKIVFSGKLSIPRQSASSLALKMGAKVVRSVSKNTDYIIVGSRPGRKAKDGEVLGVKLITEDQFMEMVDQSP